jgi:hypothetical protein
MRDDAIRRSLCGLACSIAFIPACVAEREREQDTAVVAPPATVAFTPPDSAALRAATETLAAYLDASREGSANREKLAELTACPGGADAAQGPMLAKFELLPTASRGDTVVGRAVVTTVAEQDVDRVHPGYFVARMRIRRDTLEWDVLRSGSGGWVVCNGLRFGLTAPDSLTAWRPAGASAATARALADSIAAER